MPKLLLEQLVATWNPGLKHPIRVILLANSPEKVKVGRTPTAQDILCDVGVVEVDEVDEVSLRVKERLLFFYNVLNGALDQGVVALAIVGNRHVDEDVVSLARSETKDVGAVGDGLRLRQKLDEDSVNLGDPADAVLPYLEELHVHIGRGVIKREGELVGANEDDEISPTKHKKYKTKIIFITYRPAVAGMMFPNSSTTLSTVVSSAVPPLLGMSVKGL